MANNILVSFGIVFVWATLYMCFCGILIWFTTRSVIWSREVILSCIFFEYIQNDAPVWHNLSQKVNTITLLYLNIEITTIYNYGMAGINMCICVELCQVCHLLIYIYFKNYERISTTSIFYWYFGL